MKSYQRWTAAALGSVMFTSCGGGGTSTPVNPAPVATPTPVAVATPVPTPTPEPTPEGEPPVERETAPVRITLRLFVVEDGRGGVYQYREAPDGTPLIPLGNQFRLDIIAKDKKNKETKGTGNVHWDWDDELIEAVNLNNIYHPTLRSYRPGRTCVTAELDQITSNELCLEFFPN